jgi:AAA+ superfamily predicted ATPase
MTQAAQSYDTEHADRVLDLTPALRRLDVLLEELLKTAQSRGGVAAASLRGLYISPEETECLLARAPGAPWFERPPNVFGGALTEQAAPLELLAQQYELSPFDMDLFLIALAPELDLRYERLYGFFQDDITRRRATADLALNLRTASPAEKMARLVHLMPGAPLIRNGVLHLVPDPNHVHPPLLAHYLIVDQQILGTFLGWHGLDPRLERFCRYVPPAAGLDSLQLSAEMRTALHTLGRRAVELSRPLILHFHGPPGSGRRTTAQALASDLELGLLVADLTPAAEPGGEFAASLRVLFREALLRRVPLYLEGIEELRADDKRRSYQALLLAIRRHSQIVVLASTAPWVASADDPADVISVPFGVRDFTLRRSIWQEQLAKHGAALPEAALDALAQRFRMTAGQIVNAVDVAAGRAMWRGAATQEEPPAVPALGELFAGAREQSGRELERLTRKVEPRQGWDDLVLSPDDAAQLREIAEQAKLRQLVFGAWGFDRKLSGGKGLTALFAGPPGTGKTMAAEVIAGELRLDLYKIDLAHVVSKYIGETEKNLDRVFRAAENATVVLFFDEADALFGKRSEVRDSHDRYANIEIAYLLQKMDEYEGVAILATNLRQNLDEAFVRRLQFVVEFPFPAEDYRRRIWQVTFPRETPIGADVDFAVLAREVKLAGGNIRNIAVAAAFRAAAQGVPVGMDHLLHAARREHEKLGRIWSVAA